MLHVGKQFASLVRGLPLCVRVSRMSGWQLILEGESINAVCAGFGGWRTAARVSWMGSDDKGFVEVLARTKTPRHAASSTVKELFLSGLQVSPDSLLQRTI